MRSQLALLVISSCIGSSSVACSRTGKDQPYRSDPSVSASAPEPRLGSMGLASPVLGGSSGPANDGPSGSTGNNGLDPAIYHQYQARLTALMRAPLLSSSGKAGELSGEFKNILGDADTKKLVDYTLDCALSGKFTFGAYKFPGASTRLPTKGLLRTTIDWPTKALDQRSQEDLHTCLATRLNPSRESVRIWLGGSNVMRADDQGEFPLEEALWAAVFDDPDTDDGGKPESITINVWPSQMLSSSCDSSGVRVDEAVSRRICGQADAGACGLVVRGDIDKCDKRTARGLKCHRKPVMSSGGHPVPAPTQAVIHTRMRCQDWCTIYPDCKIPSVCGGADVPQCTPSK